MPDLRTSCERGTWNPGATGIVASNIFTSGRNNLSDPPLYLLTKEQVFTLSSIVPSAFCPFCCRDTYEKRIFLPATPIFTASTTSLSSRVRFSNEPPVFIRTIITYGRKEFLQHIPVSTVNLNHIKPGSQGSMCCRLKIGNQPFDAFFI